MTHAELILELIRRKALIVHCSRPGKGGDQNPLLFPTDMTNAIDTLDTQRKVLSCSLIWPGHVETFGDVGIVLMPRSTEAIKTITNFDGATIRDPKTGNTISDGAPFSEQAVQSCFDNSIGYNEWTIDAADPVGVFVSSRYQLPEVAASANIADLEGYDPIMGEEIVILRKRVPFSEISNAFPNLPILTIENDEIIELSGAPVSPYVST